MREALNAFGDDRIYVERLLTGSRTSRFKFSPISMAEQSILVKENAVFKEDIRKSSKNLPVLL